jgi:hypothetical protein
VDERERRKEENRIVAEKLLDYPYMVERYREALDEVAFALCDGRDGVHAGVSDPTAARAIRLEKLVGDLPRWIACVEAAQSVYRSKQKKLLAMRQEFARKPTDRIGWIDYVQGRWVQEYGKLPHRQMLFAIWRNMVDICARIAAKKRLI